jgi:pyruvate/2-oxoglutarate dehydrogenase complex dihydrolipoamide dehydrogenase (E3) component
LSTTSETDVIIIGVGTCGEDLGLRLLGAGLDVVGIESSLVGGECAYWACIPSKIMIRAGNTVREAQRATQLAGDATVDPSWGRVAQRIRTEATSNWDDAFATERFGQRGGRLIHGRGRLTGPRTVTVGDESITARIGIVIATGSTPMIPPIQGVHDVDYWTTHDVIAAEELPASLVILGGGAVGCELGQVLSRFGVDVTIIEGRGHVLAAEEPEASSVIEATFADEGITVHTGSHVTSLRQDRNQIVADLDDGSHVRGDRLLLATGRRVDLSGLGLEHIDIDDDARFLPVDGRMQVTPGVWAMGDVTGKAMFTHIAVHHAAIVAGEILGEPHPIARYDAVPRVTFTDPEVGAVGMTEVAARDAGIDVVTVTKSLSATFRGWLHATSSGVIKLVIDRSTGTLVGATTAGPSGGEMLGMLTLAVHAHIPVAELQTMIYAYPTFHGGIGEAIGAYGRGVGTVLDPGYSGYEAVDEIITS